MALFCLEVVGTCCAAWLFMSHDGGQFFWLLVFMYEFVCAVLQVTELLEHFGFMRKPTPEKEAP